MNKPRPSLLDLFDPLAGALCIPLPESRPDSPITPTDSLETGADENAINGLTMSAFFKRLSKPTVKNSQYDCTSTSGPLINFGEMGAVETFSASPAMTTDDCSFLSPPQTESGFISVDTATSLNETQTVKSSFPLISVTRFSNDDDDSVSMVTKESCEDVGLTRARRRSSIDIATTISTFTSESLHAAPNASFDLLNGEISFLSKGAEEDEIYHTSTDGAHIEDNANAASQLSKGDFLKDELMGMVSTPQKYTGSIHNVHEIQQFRATVAIDLKETDYINQKVVTARGTEPSGSILLTILHEKSADGSGRDVNGKHMPVVHKQSTPPSRRRYSSVPAPTKQQRVFTSKYQQASTSYGRTLPSNYTAGTKLHRSNSTSRAMPTNLAPGQGPHKTSDVGQKSIKALDNAGQVHKTLGVNSLVTNVTGSRRPQTNNVVKAATPSSTRLQDTNFTQISRTASGVASRRSGPTRIPTAGRAGVGQPSRLPTLLNGQNIPPGPATAALRNRS
ncbi:hypothetical protein BU17DRAFT_83365 [Hysterangium stoloniferum]|nr:hypothetical protein BU17DRAFT_83365 [Hysterangium stoloniferum]